MKKAIYTFVAALFCLYAPAQEIIEPCKFGQPLIEALQQAYTPSNPLGYGPARDILYAEIDNEGNDLSGIYTGFTVTLDPNEDPSQSAFQNGSGLNAEHVFPQSLGAGDEPRRSDLHNIFPAKVNVNESRGNCPFGEIEDSDTDIWYYLNMQSNSIPSTDLEQYSEKDEEDCRFEPREAVKGDIARAIFYFYATYQSVADAPFFNQQKDILYQWHLQDPADEAELTRSNLIAAQQGNDNPFVMDSTLVRRAFFEADASYLPGDENCLSGVTSLVETSSNDWVSLASNWIDELIIVRSDYAEGSVRIYSLDGKQRLVEKWNGTTSIRADQLTSGFYICVVSAENKMATFKIYKK